MTITRHSLPFRKRGLECLLMALLVLAWGTQFKTSLYELASNCTQVPAAKLLSEAERPDSIAPAMLAAPELHPHAASPRSHAMPAFLFDLPEQAPARMVPFDPPHFNWQLMAQRGALGHFFHRPPPFA